MDKKFDKSFSFQPVSKEEIEKEILALQDGKAVRQSDIPTKIVKMNVDIFSELLYFEVYETIEFSTFPFCMKLADVTPVYKKGNRSVKDNYRPVSILPNLQKFSKGVCINKCHLILITFSQNVNVDLEKIITLSTVYWP